MNGKAANEKPIGRRLLLADYAKRNLVLLKCLLFEVAVNGAQDNLIACLDLKSLI